MDTNELLKKRQSNPDVLEWEVEAVMIDSDKGLNIHIPIISLYDVKVKIT